MHQRVGKFKFYNLAIPQNFQYGPRMRTILFLPLLSQFFENISVFNELDIWSRNRCTYMLGKHTYPPKIVKS